MSSTSRQLFTTRRVVAVVLACAIACAVVVGVVLGTESSGSSDSSDSGDSINANAGTSAADATDQYRVSTLASSLHTTFKGVVSVKEAAVTVITDHYPGSSGPSLLVSTFGVVLFGGSPSFAIPNLKDILSGNSAGVTQQIEKDQVWTNYIGMAPSSVGANLVVTAGGFLVPIGGISTGKVCLFDVTDPANVVKTQISTDKSGWFYHKVVWHDMNGDGRLDLVAARATAPKNPAGEMVWFEQPASGAVSTATHTADAWPTHVVVSGPDVDFILADLDNDGKVELIATQFFSAPILAVYACEAATWSECDEAKNNVVKTVIDDKSGPFFSVERIDLNNDGKPDLLVTNNQDDKGTDGTGSVFAYEQPTGSYSANSWTKHTLATGYVPNPTLMPSPGAHSRGSPGAATAFQAVTEATGKPQILISGDDGGFVSILRALSEDSSSWKYSEEFVCNSTGTVGTASVGDVDKDGLADIFVPFYSENKVEIYSFTKDGSAASISPKCVECLQKKDPVKLSAAYNWCYKDNQCYVVDDPFNPCGKTQCASAASASSCKCTSCNDGECHA